jgi:hypothetical protein
VTDHFAAGSGDPEVSTPQESGSPGYRSGPPLIALAVIVVAGLLWGLLWWKFAPTPGTQVIDGALYPRGGDGWSAAQDGTFAIVGAATGAIISVIWPSLTRRVPVAGVIAGVLGCVLAGLIAWWLGVHLGPDPLRVQLKAGIKTPTLPLVLNAPVAVLVAPMIFGVVRALTEMLTYAFANVHTAPPEPATSSAAQAVHIQQGQ